MTAGASTRSAASAAVAIAAPDAMRPARRIRARALLLPSMADGRPWPELTPALGGVEVELHGRAVALVRVVRRGVERHREPVAVLVARRVRAERDVLAHRGERARVLDRVVAVAARRQAVGDDQVELVRQRVARVGVA